MTGVVLAMLRARWGQAVAVALLAMFGTAAAVAAPAYLQSVDRAIAAGAVASASPAERGITITTTDGGNGPGGGAGFADVGAALIRLPGFAEVYAAEYPTLGLEPNPHTATRLVYRQDVCAHLVLLSGRCLIGEGEVLIGDQTAQRLRLTPGTPVTLTFAAINSDPTNPGYLPEGTPKTVTVVGTYRTPQTSDGYWGPHGYFAADQSGRTAQPLFTTNATIAAMDHAAITLSVDAVAAPGTFDISHLATLSGQLKDLNTRIYQLGNGFTVNTSMPDLLSRIARSRAIAHQVVPVAAVPLVLLAWFVIFVAVGYGTDRRSGELALVSLRGSRLPARWWLAAGEHVLAILAGAVVGCVAGQVIVDRLTRWRLAGGGGPLLTGLAVSYAIPAALGALLAALLAQRRYLVSPVADLLRRVSRPAARWRSLAGEVVVVALAVAAVAQLWASGWALSGVGLLSPALVMLALALVGSRALVPLAARGGAWALRRGRLGPGLAGLQLARRPGARRLYLILVGAVALLGFVACAVDVAGQDRTIRAQVGTGAPRVLSVEQVTRYQLLHAVRAADPQGRYAMAVAEFPPGAPGQAPVLGVDSARLASVANWPASYGALSAGQVAERLRPPAPDPMTLRGQDIALDVEAAGAVLSNPLDLTLVLSSVDGGGTTLVSFGLIRDGSQVYQQRVPTCLDGCRLVGLHVSAEGIGGNGFSLTLTLRALGTTTPDRTSVTPAEFADTARWRAPTATLSPTPAGLRADFHTTNAGPAAGWIQPVDAPDPLPALSTDALSQGATVAGLDGLPTAVTPIGRVTALPRLGTDGTLVDLEYADRLSTDAGSARNPEIWLGPAAPADILTRLAAQGLVVTDDQGVDSVRRQLDRQGPALALWFHLLAAGLAVVLAGASLGLVATVDRSQAEDLAALRRQGLAKREADRAVLWTYPVMVLAALVAGSAVALLAWWIAGPSLPVFADGRGALPLAHWPRPLAVLWPLLGALALLLGTAVAAGRRWTTR
jgi:hypothetical protein